MIEEISNKLLGQFAQCLQDSVGQEPAPVPAAGRVAPEALR